MVQWTIDGLRACGPHRITVDMSRSGDATEIVLMEPDDSGKLHPVCARIPNGVLRALLRKKDGEQ